VTRRIALSVLALITALLVLAVVPLGLLMTQHEREAFRQTAQATDLAIGSAAEEHLSDHHPTAAMVRLLDQTWGRGDCAAVYDASGRTVAKATCDTASGGAVPGLVKAVLADPESRTVQTDDRLTLATPIGDAGHPVGVAVLSRSLEPMKEQLVALWGGLIVIGGAGLVAAILLSVGLARWVGRPLREVDAAARRLGEGALDVRAPVGRGPQEVRRLAATFNTMAGRTQTLVHDHRAVVADVSHQLRTPLAALRLRLDLLSVDADAEVAAELVGAQEEIARLSRLVDGLLAVARAENAVPRPVAVRVDEVVAERVAAWEPVASERQVTLTAHCREGLSAYLGAGDAEQLLDNLVANALDAVPAGGRVRIQGTAGHDAVRIRVIDNGPGMAAAARESAFRRFGGTSPGGTGLGLAIVHRLITANGGAIHLKDTPGGGLTAVLELSPVPRDHGRDTDPDTQSASPLSGPEAQGRLGSADERTS
jgi:signal transduction histidine kinase